MAISSLLIVETVSSAVKKVFAWRGLFNYRTQILSVEPIFWTALEWMTKISFLKHNWVENSRKKESQKKYKKVKKIRVSWTVNSSDALNCLCSIKIIHKLICSRLQISTDFKTKKFKFFVEWILKVCEFILNLLGDATAVMWKFKIGSVVLILQKHLLRLNKRSYIEM